MAWLLRGDWVVLLEAVAPGVSSALTLAELRRLVEALGEQQSGALHHPQRYALQIPVAARHAGDALSTAVERWRAALRQAGLPEWTLCRVEILTQEELDRELQLGDAALTPAVPASRQPVGSDPILESTARTGLELLRDAFSDPVTGLADGVLFHEEVRLALERRTPGQSTAVLVLDIDSFRDVNTMLGYALGDEVLAVVARRLRQTGARGEVVARLGGDRFAMLLACGSAGDGARLGESVLPRLREGISVCNHTVQLTATVGVAASAAVVDPEDLLDRAVAAVGRAKRSGGDQVAVFDPRLDAGGDTHEPDEVTSLDRLSHVLLLQRAATTAGTSRDLREACELVMREVCAQTGWAVGHLYLTEPGGGRLVPGGVDYVCAIEPYLTFAAASRQRAYDPGTGVPGRVLATGEAAWAVGAQADWGEELTRLAAAASLRSTIAFPVLVGDEVAAVLEFFGTDAHPPDGALIEVMTTIGAQLGRIVERSRAETAVADAELRYRALAEAAGDAIVSFDDQHIVVSWNRAAARMFGYAEAEIVGRPLSSLLIPVAIEPGKKAGAPGASGRADGPLAMTGIRKDGSTFRAEVCPSAWTAGGRRFFTDVVRDLTASERAQAAGSLATAFAEDLLVVDPGGTVLHYSGSACGTGGVPPASLPELIHPDDLDRLLAAVARCAGGEPVAGAVQARRRAPGEATVIAAGGPRSDGTAGDSLTAEALTADKAAGGWQVLAWDVVDRRDHPVLGGVVLRGRAPDPAIGPPPLVEQMGPSGT